MTAEPDEDRHRISRYHSNQEISVRHVAPCDIHIHISTLRLQHSRNKTLFTLVTIGGCNDRPYYIIKVESGIPTGSLEKLERRKKFRRTYARNYDPDFGEGDVPSFSESDKNIRAYFYFHQELVLLAAAD